MELGISRVQDGEGEGRVELVQGQVWWDFRDNCAIELVGRDNIGRWSVRVWEPVRVGRGGLEPRDLEREARRSGRHGFPPRGLAVVLREGSECYGGGTRVMMDVSPMFSRGTGTRVILGPDRAVGPRLVAEVVNSVEVEVDSHERGRRERFYDSVLEELKALPNPVIVTDGSFWREGQLGGLMEPGGSGKGAGAVVVMDEEWDEHRVYTWRFEGGEREFKHAYDLESAMVCAAAGLASELGQGEVCRPKVLTDCEAVVKATEKTRGGLPCKSNYATIEYIRKKRHFGEYRGQQLDLTHVRGHPDRRYSMAEFDWRDFGIYFADLVAGGKDLELPDGRETRSTVDISEAFVDLGAEGEFYWKKDGTPLMRGFRELFEDHWRKEYVRKRDEYRGARDLPPKWEGLTLKFAASLWKKQGEGLAAAARNNRLLFDKVWDGRNEGKGKGAGEEKGRPLACPFCGGADGMDHWVRECGDEDLAKIRREVEGEVRCVVAKALKARKGSGWKPSAGYYGFSAALPRMVLEGDDRVWCGHWSEEKMGELEQFVGGMEEGELLKVKGVIRGVGEVTVRGVIKLWEKRKEKRGEGRRFFEGDEEDDEENLVRDGKYWQERGGMEQWLGGSKHEMPPLSLSLFVQRGIVILTL